ncbi:RNA exonuclease 4 [Olea europaea subsp. europaea]|uniref:RNA exonuclease 4 n=1 Tax=Olea europaea subsp. europaea TaxID=158383 RepID=A0A8S0RF28_OLEEU|nr:RNA exonuclease 4 [Olea europaea subsp. europaea]
MASNLNPNWAQLLETLKSNGSNKHFSKHSQRSDGATEKTVLGKRKERSNDNSEAVKPNPLVPTSSDCSLTDVVAMDCEMVGVSSLGNKSALGRVALVNKWGNVIYDEYVRPLDHVVDFRTKISGIRPRDLRKAKNFNVVQKKVAELIKGRILVGHALHNDLKVSICTNEICISDSNLILITIWSTWSQFFCVGTSLKSSEEGHTRYLRIYAFSKVLLGFLT